MASCSSISISEAKNGEREKEAFSAGNRDFSMDSRVCLEI